MPFRCHQVVQHGSPLSPALFGMFVDALQRLMQGNAGCDVPELGHPVPLLLCADDLVLIGRSASGGAGLYIQRWLDLVLGDGDGAVQDEC